MSEFDRRKHWNKIYQTKNTADVSWYQQSPDTSLDFVNNLKLPKSAKIIDIGGGESFFVDNLLEQGYKDITVLDISESAIDKAKNRLGKKSNRVKWIIADITEFVRTDKYDFWHDRAAFHFLNDEKEVDLYVQCAHSSVKPEGYMVIGTFSEQGPKKCSGITIRQYSPESMARRFLPWFQKLECLAVDHHTPFDTTQNFVFCSFKHQVHH